MDLVDPTWKDNSLEVVPTSPFGTPRRITMKPPQMSMVPADKQLSLRVEKIGNGLLAANPEIGMKPLFATAGTPSLELFHQGQSLIYITEGLVKKTNDDSQLAAVLAHEMAEMVAEREVLAHPSMRQPEERMPSEVRIGNAGQMNDSDLTHMVELAKYEKRREEARNKPLPIPDPQKLARRYLRKAGYPEESLDQILPLLTEAEKTFALEKQLRTTGPEPIRWAPKLQQNQPTTDLTNVSSSPAAQATRSPSPNNATNKK